MSEPTEKTTEKDEYEVVVVYKGEETIIEYDMDDKQHVYVRNEG